MEITRRTTGGNEAYVEFTTRQTLDSEQKESRRKERKEVTNRRTEASAEGSQMAVEKK